MNRPDRPDQPAATAPDAQAKPPGLPEIEVNEYGGKKDGVRQSMNRRLFMQLLVFDAPQGTTASEVASRIGQLIRERSLPAVIYADAMHPKRIGLLTWS